MLDCFVTQHYASFRSVPSGRDEDLNKCDGVGERWDECPENKGHRKMRMPISNSIPSFG